MTEKNILKELKELVQKYELLEKLKNLVFNWEEKEHSRDKEGRFINKTNGSLSKHFKYDKINSKKYKSIKFSKEEYALVIHELNSNLSKEERKMKSIVKNIGNYRYTILNNGFNEYEIIKKERIDDI